MKEQKEINLRIADLAPISLSVTHDEELTWRDARDLVNQLWKSWSTRFPDKSSKEILAMVALRFAQAFVVNSEAAKKANDLLEDFEKSLDKLLIDDVVDLKG